MTGDTMQDCRTCVPVESSFYVLEKSDSVLTPLFKVTSCHFLQLLVAFLLYMNASEADMEKLECGVCFSFMTKSYWETVSDCSTLSSPFTVLGFYERTSPSLLFFMHSLLKENENNSSQMTV